MKAFHKLGWMDELLEHKGAAWGGFSLQDWHLAAIQLPVQDNKAPMQQLLYTILHLLLAHEYGIADRTGITRLSPNTHSLKTPCLCWV